jgi:N-acetylmuramic acid 6-phosphate etherase
MLKTEMRNPNTTHIDTMSTMEMLQTIQQENINAVHAVGDQLPAIARAVDAITAAFNAGGRLIYMGAGTSGRLGVIDATECPPTFGVSPEQVVGIIAGGRDAMFRSSENQEDNAVAGVRDLKAANLRAEDVLVGISAAGGAAYVIGGLEYAKSLGCVTVGVTSNAGTLLDTTADIAIVCDTGAEVVTGSTRMKAGTAQKLVLNMLSTCPMIQTGKVYQNLMINLNASNEKLTGRMKRIVAEILTISTDEAEIWLEKAGWNIRRAIALFEAQ